MYICSLIYHPPPPPTKKNKKKTPPATYTLVVPKHIQRYLLWVEITHIIEIRHTDRHSLPGDQL